MVTHNLESLETSEIIKYSSSGVGKYPINTVERDSVFSRCFYDAYIQL